MSIQKRSLRIRAIFLSTDNLLRSYCRFFSFPWGKFVLNANYRHL
nr:MAG TPA: hypothetical protein [Caudoviricetes sp.]